MATDLKQAQQRGRVMVVVGLIGLVVSVIWLLAVTEPFPMWLIIAGGGLVFIGAGSALGRQR